MTLSDIYNNQYKETIVKNPKEIEKLDKPKQINLVLHMPEVRSLVKHLDLLYLKMIHNDSQESQTISYFNPGQGSVKQSDSVN